MAIVELIGSEYKPKTKEEKGKKKDAAAKEKAGTGPAAQGAESQAAK